MIRKICTEFCFFYISSTIINFLPQFNWSKNQWFKCIFYRSLSDCFQFNLYFYSMKKENFLIQNILPYIGLWWLFLISFWENIFFSYQKYIFLWLLWLVLKDIFIHFVEIKPMKIKVLSPIQDDIWFFTRLIILNRKKFFPGIFTFYILQLLVKQTNIWGLQNTTIFQIFNDNFLLIILVISWFLTIFKENIENQYESEVESMYYTIGWMIVSFTLALIGAYIILNQTWRLGNLSYMIAFISWILIFLIWIMVLQDDEESQH